MWVAFAFASAIFAGLTSILAKIGIKDTDSNVATALRTAVVLVFAWLMVLLTGAGGAISALTGRNLLFLVLSGLATGLSWICYFRAIALGQVSRVVPVDKSSTVLAMILGFLYFREPFGWLPALGLLLILGGTLLMSVAPGARGEKRAGRKDLRWLIYALLSAVFAALTSVLAKIGIEGVPSDLGTAVRTVVVLVLAWGIVLAQGKLGQVRHIGRRSLLFIVLSGLATGLSWLCYYRAISVGLVSVVVPIDKLSIVLTVVFSAVILRERISWRAWLGLGLIALGTAALLL